MKKTVPIALAFVVAGSTFGFAQTTVPPTTPSTPPSASMPASPSTSAVPSTVTPSARTSPSDGLTLTEEQARTWIDKPVYSSDGKNLGEVAAFTRDASGKVTEMHADVGGFLGIGETRVRLMPSQFSMGTDRVVTTLTAEQAKTLPKITK